MRGETRCQTVLLLDTQDGKEAGEPGGGRWGTAKGWETFPLLALLLGSRQ